MKTLSKFIKIKPHIISETYKFMHLTNKHLKAIQDRQQKIIEISKERKRVEAEMEKLGAYVIGTTPWAEGEIKAFIKELEGHLKSKFGKTFIRVTLDEHAVEFDEDAPSAEITFTMHFTPELNVMVNAEDGEWDWDTEALLAASKKISQAFHDSGLPVEAHEFEDIEADDTSGKNNYYLQTTVNLTE